MHYFSKRGFDLIFICPLLGDFIKKYKYLCFYLMTVQHIFQIFIKRHFPGAVGQS